MLYIIFLRSWGVGGCDINTTLKNKYGHGVGKRLYYNILLLYKYKGCVMYFKLINPIAKALAYNKKRKQIIKNKKGKGSYERAENRKTVKRQEEK
mgnify:CR=1 FL=1